MTTKLALLLAGLAVAFVLLLLLEQRERQRMFRRTEERRARLRQSNADELLER
ncbi:MAG: hypothetical protein AB7O57_08345 [Hyphomicrobiaceae bacterium]